MTVHQVPNDKSTNKNKKNKLWDNTLPLSLTHTHAHMSQQPLNYPIPPFIITIQWAQNSWYIRDNLINVEV